MSLLAQADTHSRESVAAPSPTAPAGRIYRPELDALRFFAFGSVFLHHTLGVCLEVVTPRWPHIGSILLLIQQSCGLGLCLFFFLSSYLITSLLRIEKEKTGTVDLRKFYLRRVLRIWPLYFTYILAVAAVGIWWQPLHVEATRLLALSFLAGNWYLILFGNGTAAITHLWSISVEEQFYLIWPRLSSSLAIRHLCGVCVVISLVALSTTWVLLAHGSTTLWFNSIVQSLFFATGALMALGVGIRTQTPSLRTALFFTMGGCLICGAGEKVGGLTDHRAFAYAPWAGTTGYALAAVGCAALLWGFLHIPRHFLKPPILYLGRISYGLYVFHELFLVSTRGLLVKSLHIPGVNVLASIVLTFIAAPISYEFLEKPFLKLKSRFELVKTRTV